MFGEIRVGEGILEDVYGLLSRKGMGVWGVVVAMRRGGRGFR